MAYSPLLTQQQFGLTKAAKAGGTYARYTSYVKNTRAKRAAARKPAPKLSGLALQNQRLFKKTGNPNYIGDYLSPIPYAQLKKSATSYINAQTGPVLANIAAQYDAQRKSGTSNIQAVAHDLLAQLAGLAPSSNEAYTKAMTNQALINSSLADFLQGAGKTAAGDVGSQLAAINAPGGASSPLAANLAALGQSAAGVSAARGDATLSQLNSEMGAAGTYFAKQPGIAAQDAIRRESALMQQIQQQESQDMGGVTSKIPGESADYMNSLLDREFQKAVANQGYQVDQSRYGSPAYTGVGVPDPTLSKLLNNGTVVDKYGKPTGDTFTPKPTPTKTSAAAKAQTSAITRAQEKAFTLATQLYANKAAGNSPFEAHTPIANNAAYRQVYALLSYYLGKYNLPPARLDAYARSALIAAGYGKFARIPKATTQRPG